MSRPPSSHAIRPRVGRRAPLAMLALALAVAVAPAGDPPPVPAEPVEAEVVDPKLSKVVLIAGTNKFKPGEHDYVAGCGELARLLRQTPDIAPVVAHDWPRKPTTLAGAKAVVFFFDGGDKHHALKEKRPAEVAKLVADGVGLVQLHQTADYPTAAAERARDWAGGAWEAGGGKRAHWVTTFDTFPDHPVFRGVKPFTIDDGWLWNVRFAPGKKGVTPLLRTVNPKSKDDVKADGAAIAWAFERPGGGRSFTFTGGHLHKSFEQEGYRRTLVNAILWTAGVEVPAGGALVKAKD